jgi:hypothetical protein
MVFRMHVDAYERFDPVLRLVLFQSLSQHDRNQLKLVDYSDMFCHKINKGLHPGLVAFGL